MSGRDEVEEFAALLRRLKDRTDRSYGSLARRVTMNTSTLHRYCAGEAVPQDFAPVERLAAFCEATPQERLELHRLWLAAVAARQRARSPSSGEPAAAPASPSPLPPSSLAQPSSPSASAASPAYSTSAASPASSAPGALPDGSSGPRPRPWYRRRRVWAATAVVCAVLATLRGTNDLPDDRSPQASAVRPGGPRTAVASAPHRSVKPSASASPAPSRGAASPGPRHTDPVAKAAGGGPSARPPAGLPLAWSTSLIWDMGCGQDYVVDKPTAQVPPPPVEQDAGAWAVSQGAVHGRETRVRISVQGRSSTAVVLEALHVRIVSRDSPSTGIAYSMGQGCGGDLTPRNFTVNLDADRPVTRPRDGSDKGESIPAVRFPYRVSAEDPEVLLVDATTQTYDARWYLELDWSSQGRTGTIRIDDHGRPFRTSSIKGLPHYWFGTDDAGARAWVPLDD
ncbi:helix-turn-helix domain-containing protein [Streptomyces sp. NBC_00704]|uniref:helix-turn-helix domain-containing protein n=1 Tax=Streptomyces sp. NBC_00704 TaxID=2975809 RepID=UPI002E3243F0|nr:helix-turn-helix transcriptional regulator [Streptomyces sp. NBC_00704]